MTETPIQHISDTAFWVAIYRAHESERTDALFHDPLAARLVAGRGQDIAAKITGTAAVSWSVSIRTVIIDAYIQTAVSQGVDTILNLGAGLDTRPYRMDLPSTLRWIEVDFPDLITFKAERLAGEIPRCQLERYSLDLAQIEERRKLFADIAGKAQRVLILTEGVVPYLTLEQAGSLAKDLYEQPQFKFWVVDRFAGAIIKARNHAGHSKALKNVPFQFLPEDWEAFFARYGWQILHLKSLAAESRRLGRGTMPGLPWWVKFIWPVVPEAKRQELDAMTSYALLERTRSLASERMTGPAVS